METEMKTEKKAEKDPCVTNKSNDECISDNPKSTCSNKISEQMQAQRSPTERYYDEDEISVLIRDKLWRERYHRMPNRYDRPTLNLSHPNKQYRLQSRNELEPALQKNADLIERSHEMLSSQSLDIADDFMMDQRLLKEMNR